MPILSSFGAMSAIGRAQRAGERKRVALVLSANVNNYVLDVAKVAGYEPGNTDVELIVNAGVVIGSTSTGSFALDINTSWATGDTIKIVNNGTIVGRGGNGGSGDNSTCSVIWEAIVESYRCQNNGSAYTPGVAGSAGPAIRAQRTITLVNNGTIAGGGGGGKGYGANYNGAGGGQGALGGTGGMSGGIYACTSEFGSCDYMGPGGAAGGSGTVSAPGGGASSGGVLGSQGGNNGGAAGACTSGNANITWLATGTRHGALN